MPRAIMMDDIDNGVDSENDDILSADEQENRPPLTCQRCSVAHATVICRGCLGQFLCQACDSSCHEFAWQAHVREPLTRNNPLAVTEGLLSNLVDVEGIKQRVRELVITHIESQKTSGCAASSIPPRPP